MGDIDAYRTSACNGLGQEIGARLAWCKRNLAALMKVVTNQRATVGLQNPALLPSLPYPALLPILNFSEVTGQGGGRRRGAASQAPGVGARV